jgi:hypothetical protein
MFRYMLMAALLCGTLFAGQAQADNLWLSLNLEFNNPSDSGSGGTWTVVAKADRRGLAGVVLDFVAASLNFNPATGFLTPPEFEIEQSSISGMRLEILQGDDIFTGSPVYDIGVIGGTYPSTYVDDPLLTEFGGNPDLGSFTGGIALVTGSFNPGDIPTWWTGAGGAADGNLYTGTGFQVVAPDVFTTVRYVAIPEPASVLLLCGSMVSLAAMRRR